MANFTRKELEEMRNNVMLRAYTDLFGIDLDEVVKEGERQLKREEERERIAKEFAEKLKNIRTRQPKIVAEPVVEKEEYVAPQVEKTFVMNYEQFKKFIKDYSELLNAVKKIDYWYGIKFDTSSTGFSFEGKVREIIWDLIGVIFGEDNREDIADYIYGNSNFDSPEALYNELT